MTARRFLLRFVLAVALFYGIVAVRPVNDAVIEPFTRAIARAAALPLRAIGESVAVSGTILRSPRFAVSVQNGCNGIEALIVLAAAVVAFPAGVRSKFAIIAAGFAIIEAVNLLRVVSLFWLGAHHPAAFETFHAAIWQTAIVILALVIFVLWSRRNAPRSTNGR
jgi:exosortase H (IPTLxxWG-CTERM-specific)